MPKQALKVPNLYRTASVAIKHIPTSTLSLVHGCRIAVEPGQGVFNWTATACNVHGGMHNSHHEKPLRSVV